MTMLRIYRQNELSARYPDRNSYIAGANRLSAANVAAGYLLPADARTSRKQVQQVFHLLP